MFLQPPNSSSPVLPFFLPGVSLSSYPQPQPLPRSSLDLKPQTPSSEQFVLFFVAGAGGARERGCEGWAPWKEDPSCGRDHIGVRCSHDVVLPGP